MDLEIKINDEQLSLLKECLHITPEDYDILNRTQGTVDTAHNYPKRIIIARKCLGLSNERHEVAPENPFGKKP